jgi:predicted extracellular nuclease
VVELGAVTTNPNGLFTVAKGTFTLNAVTPDLIASLNFENSDNVTHLIVSGLTGGIGDDLDADDDGTLDTEPWTEVVNSVSLIESVDSGEQVYGIESVGPDGNFVPAHSYRCPDGIRIGKFSTTDADAKDTPTLQNDCAVVILPAVDRTIPEIQGDGFASPFDGGRVRTTGIVTADFQAEGELSGFYLQDPVGDSNSATSDGIFVFEGTTSLADVKVGDSVTVEADVTEFFELTELNNVGSVIINSSANPVPAPAAVTLPESLDGDLERYEGMLVSIDSVMTVSQTTLLDRSGQLVLSSPNDAGSAGRLFQPTNLFPAGSPEALNLADENARRILVLDDARSADSDEISFIGAPPATVIRAGDTVSNLVGVLDYGLVDGGLSRSDYRLQPTEAPSFTATNPREAMPSPVNGTLTVASFNVLNFFTTLDERGADTASELIRQEAKLVSALVEINADVVGLIEVENNGLGAGSATRRLVDAINTELGSIEYDILPVGDLFTPLGTDAITVAFIYKPTVVAPKGAVVTLATGAFDQTLTDGGRSRQPIAATFVEVASGEVFTAVINHFKSKRAPSSMQNNGNDDQGDGQGGWNLRRTEAATDLAAWLATNPTGVDDSDVLILGDLNAYAQEDPILALVDAGYADLVRQFEGEQGYSYAFGGQSGYLDHALASSSLVSQLSGVTTWHINSDEPSVLSYDEDFNPAGYFQADQFRSSDHDPVIVGLALGQSAAPSEGCFVIPLKTKKAVVFCL